MLNLEATFTHARKTRTTRLGLAPCSFTRLGTPLWLLAIHDPDRHLAFGLVTNRPILNPAQAETVLVAWRYRPQIAHTCRLDQEAGLGVEYMRVHTLAT